MSRSAASAVASVPARVAGTVPRPVAHIMGRKGRRAKRRPQPPLAGHRAGVEAVRRVTRAARAMGIEALTLYAFSSENWRRPEEEVSDLMGLLRLFIRSDLAELCRENVRLRIIGDYRRFAPDLVAMVDDAVARTAGNSGPLLAIALNYGAQAELAAVARRLAATLPPEHITEAAIEAALDTAELPPLDLLIRTSGEQRLSNFLLWQAAYAELLFVDTLWPDFDAASLAAAVAAFGQRQRRYGGL